MAKFVSYSCSPYGTADIKTGSPNITISSGIATLTVAQTGNIGTGDNITFGSTSVYIALNRLPFTSGGTTELKPGDRITGVTSGATGIVRFVEVTSGTWAGGDAAGYIYFESTTGTFNSSEQLNRDRPSSSTNIATANGALQGNIGNGNTQFVVKAPTGNDAADQTSTSVTSIHHEYASLNALEAGFTDANHLNSTDLTSAGADVCVFAACYYDHDDYTADTSAVTINFGTTDSSHYFQAYAPIGGTESVNKQRHNGKWDSNKCLFSFSGAWDYITIDVDYTVLQGLQFEQTYIGGLDIPTIVGYDTTSGNNRKVDSCILRRVNANSSDSYKASGIRFSGENNNVINNIIYDYNGNSASFGIQEYASTASIDLGTIFNNTVINCSHGIQVSYNYYSGITATIKNNLCSGNSTSDFSNNSVTVTASNNASSDATAPGTNSRTNQDFSSTFVDADNDDYHLASSDTVAKDYGTDLSTDANLPIWQDIDGEDRAGGTWDIGADEYVAAGTTYYQSVSGTMGTITGSIAKAISVTRLGSMPAPSGSIAKQTSVSRYGNLPSPSGEVSTPGSYSQSLTGNLPAPTGSLTKAIAKNLAGIMGTITGSISKATSKLLSGAMPEPNGSVSHTFNTSQSVSGIMGAITGVLTTIKNPVSSAVKLLKIIGSSFKKLID